MISETTKARSLFSSFFPSRSSRLRGSLKKDIGKLRECDILGGVRSLLGD
ncbi:hypothetical protein [Trichormus variabilis]|nr:hypothetical protein [Trichormus variabilis]MBD2626423.1 hypothetical protein [Trichormus variabilis FACHB-164]